MSRTLGFSPIPLPHGQHAIEVKQVRGTCGNVQTESALVIVRRFRKTEQTTSETNSHEEREP